LSVIANSSSTSLTGVPIRPFCTDSGFVVTTSVDHDEFCDTGGDVYVIFVAKIKAGTVVSRFQEAIASDISRYFSNIVYAPTTGSPTLTETHEIAEGTEVAIAFRFRINFPATADTTSLTFPFVFAPNFFFGDVPWVVHISASGPDPFGDPLVPAIPPNANYNYDLAGTVLFDAPYYPLVGDQNVSDHYDELTGFWRDPNADRTHSLMLLPDALGNPPVLTVDVPVFILGFFADFADRGNLLMSPGAQVRVLEADTLALGRVDMFTCVDEVSKGIVVYNTGMLEQENCTFSDAELALHLKRGSTFRSFGAVTFQNNYLGMRIDNSGSPSIPNIVAQFGLFNTFRNNTLSLKLPYTGMPTPSTTLGYGLDIINHPGINLFNPSFFDLNSGVRLVRSSFNTFGAFFSGITKDAGTTIPHQGWAIWGFGSGTDSLSASSINVFADRGISVENMHATIRASNIVADEGISLTNCKMKKIDISHNTGSSRSLTCRYYAIKSRNCLPLKAGSQIYNNRIVMNNTGNTSLTGTGILFGEGAQVTSPNATGWIVSDNILELDGTRWGIRGVGLNSSQLLQNNITVMNDDHPDVIGVDVINTTDLNASCNIVSSEEEESQAKGYYFRNVNQSDYICNKTDQLLRGMEFSTLCEGTTLKGSEFKNTPTGLLLRADVTLGTQGLDGMTPVQDHGNRWVSSSEATHEAIDQDVVDFSRFGVDPDEDPEFLPTNNQIDWFIDEPTPSLPSFTCTGFVCLTPGAYSYYVDRVVERAVADSSIHSVGLPGVLPLILENHLYAELQKNPVWAVGDTLFYQFLQRKLGSTTEAFWQLRQDMDVLDNRDSTEQATVGTLETTIANLRHGLYLMDTTFAGGGTINDSLYSLRLESLSSATESLRVVLDTIRAHRLALAAQLLTDNASISATQTWEETMMAVNAIEIQLFIQDSINATQLGILDSIGTLCPYTHGEAVYRAEVLYNRYEEKEFSPVCTEERGQAKGQKNESLTGVLKVFPNPSTGWVTIPNPDAATRTILVLDIAGKLVFQATTSASELDLSGLGNGVYLLRVQDTVSGTASTIKLVISK